MPGGSSTWPRRSRSSAIVGIEALIVADEASAAMASFKRARSAAMDALMSPASAESPKFRRASGKSEARTESSSSSPSTFYEEIRLHEQTSGRPHERDMQQRAPRVSPPSPTETGPRHWSKSHQRQRRPKQGTIHQKKADGARYVPRMGPAPSLRQLGAPRKHWT
eukprot:scaffold322048_cov28-Tisochrysis_lutea.AAC.2